MLSSNSKAFASFPFSALAAIGTGFAAEKIEGEAAGLDASSLGNFCRQRFQIGAPSSSAEG